MTKYKRWRYRKQNTAITNEKQEAIITPAEFDSDAFIAGYCSSDKHMMQIIGLYFKLQKMKFATKEIANGAVSRQLRVASKIVKQFSPAQVRCAIEYCNSHDNLWTWSLDTLFRIMNTEKYDTLDEKINSDILQEEICNATGVNIFSREL